MGVADSGIGLTPQRSVFSKRVLSGHLFLVCLSKTLLRIQRRALPRPDCLGVGCWPEQKGRLGWGVSWGWQPTQAGREGLQAGGEGHGLLPGAPQAGSWARRTAWHPSFCVCSVVLQGTQHHPNTFMSSNHCLRTSMWHLNWGMLVLSAHSIMRMFLMLIPGFQVPVVPDPAHPTRP